MNRTEASRLHSKDEPHMVGGAIYSMLDLLGATVTCDCCGAWQRLPSLFGEDVKKLMEERGWQHAGGDVHHCPNCKAPA